MKYMDISVDLKKGVLKLPDGHTLTLSEASDISSAYERLCTAQYVKDLHPRFSEKRSWEVADEARTLMADYGYDEEEAICEALSSNK